MTKTSTRGGLLTRALSCGCAVALAASLAPAAGIAWAADADKDGIQDVPKSITFVVQQENASGGVTQLGTIGYDAIEFGGVLSSAGVASSDQFYGTYWDGKNWGGVYASSASSVSLEDLFGNVTVGGKLVSDYLEAAPNAKVKFESGYTNSTNPALPNPAGITNFGPYEAAWSDIQAADGFYGNTTASKWDGTLTPTPKTSDGTTISGIMTAPSIVIDGETAFVTMRTGEATTVTDAISAASAAPDYVTNSGFTLLMGVSPENAAAGTSAQKAADKANFVQGVNRITVTLPYAPYEKTSRVAGSEWADTMYDSVMKTFSGNTESNIVVATAVSYHDALAASGFAGSLSAPILMTDQASLTPQTEKAITRLTSGLGADDALNVYVIGGVNAISNAVMDEIKAMPVFGKVAEGNVTRLAGTEAWDTALEVFKAYSTGNTPGTNAWANDANGGPIICTSQSYMDALSIAPYAYASKRPVILTNSDNVLTDAAKSTINAYYKTTAFATICGGPNAVSYTVQTQLTTIPQANVKRFAGYEWDETSNIIATALVNNDANLVNAGTKFTNADTVGIATADDYYDALASAAYCGTGAKCMPLVLVSSKQDNTYTIENFVSDFSKTAKPAGNLTKAVIFGGNVIIPDGIQLLAENALS